MLVLTSFFVVVNYYIIFIQPANQVGFVFSNLGLKTKDLKGEQGTAELGAKTVLKQKNKLCF